MVFLFFFGTIVGCLGGAVWVVVENRRRVREMPDED